MVTEETEETVDLKGVAEEEDGAVVEEDVEDPDPKVVEEEEEDLVELGKGEESLIATVALIERKLFGLY